MKERPLIMYPHEVRAVRDGRQSQFRRMVRTDELIENASLCNLLSVEEGTAKFEWRESVWSEDAGMSYDECYCFDVKCPYGVPGDRLFVKETWAHALDFGYSTGQYFYKATYVNGGIYDDVERWNSPVTMPREASRLLLEVVSVHVERLQEISINDAISNGCFANFTPSDGHGFRSEARNLYSHLWDSINGKKHTWEDNPWVWVVEFKRIENRG